MDAQLSTFVINHETRSIDPITLVTDGLKIGRLPDCELVLNHPTVSRLHAGIKEIGGRFYIFNFSHSNATSLNGRLLPVEEAEALADGDVIEVGPFFMTISRSGQALHLNVAQNFAINTGEVEDRGEPLAPPPVAPPPAGAHGAAAHGAAGGAAASPDVSESLNVFWKKRQREAGKMARASPLRPQPPSPGLGKARFNWTPTRDLVRPWPFAIFTWGGIVVVLFTVAAAIGLTTAFSPAPLSDPHARNTLEATPAIAKVPNANSCTSCHSVKASMEDSCTSCHQAQAFVATVTQPHLDAKIGCTACHTEHRGEAFRPGAASLSTCVNCHNDSNKTLYNGRRVGTPHEGTFGYPVVGEKWTWEGLEPAEWEHKSPEMREALARWKVNDENQRRSAQFHILHLHRVRVVPGLEGNEDGEMSCSTCHQTFGAALDRETPRSTCAKCHNGEVDQKYRTGLIAADAPNCTSCHVQHTKGRRPWGSSLIATASARPTGVPQEAAQTAVSSR